MLIDEEKIDIYTVIFKKTVSHRYLINLNYYLSNYLKNMFPSVYRTGRRVWYVDGMSSLHKSF